MQLLGKTESLAQPVKMENSETLYHVKGRDTMKTIDVIFVSDELVGSTIVSKKEYERLMRQKIKTEIESNKNEPNNTDESKETQKRKGYQDDLDGEVKMKRSKYVDDVELALAALENVDVEKVEVSQPSTLFDDGDISAKKMYNFENSVTPMKGSHKSSVETPNNVKTNQPNTMGKPKERKQVSKENDSAQTPFSIRRKMIRDIKHIQKILENSDEDDFSGSDSDSSFRLSDNSLSDSQNSDSETKTKKNSSQKSFFENYCDLQSAKKSNLSVNSLKKLKTSKLTQEKLDEIVKNFEASSQHKNCIKTLFKEILGLFDKWDFILKQNYNLLLYGAGSKREIIGKFVERFLDVSPVIVVNGFFPDVTGREIVDKICSILKIKPETTDGIEKIEQKIRNYEMDIYLAINNIDGIMLRNKKVQNMLSRLGKIEQIHVIASIDHINAPLIWDNRTSSEFNWVWFDSTTFINYAEETLYEGNLMLQNSGKATLSSLRNVFAALTKNSRGIFLIMIKNQVESGNKKTGISFRELYEECRRELLISTDVALRSQLKEFVDHAILKQKKNADGEEQFMIMMETNILKQFLDEQEGNQC